MFEARERIFVDVGDAVCEQGKGAVQTHGVGALGQHKAAADALQADGTAQVVVRADARNEAGDAQGAQGEALQG